MESGKPSGAHAPRFFLVALFFLQPWVGLASDFEATGLLDMPTARFQSDGALTIGISQQDTEDVYAVSYQAMPWLEGTFRYIVFNPGKKADSVDTLRDRSFSFKARLLEEGRYVPALAFGVRDLLGTGVLSAEYVVGSKQFGPLDTTLGLGWGRLGSRSSLANPLRILSDRFAEPRVTSDFGQGGTPDLEDLFRGKDVGLFGGVQLNLPYRTRLVAEWSSDRYLRETGLGTLKDPQPLSYGLGWRPTAGVDVVASYQLGEDFALSVSAALDTRSFTERKPSPAYWSVDEPPERRDQVQGFTPDSWYARLLYDVERSGVLLLSGDLRDRGRSAWLEIENGTFAYEADAIERVLSLAELHIPKSVRSVHLILQNDGVVQSHVLYRRIAGQGGTLPRAVLEDAARIAILPPRPMPKRVAFRTGYRKPMFNFGASLGQRLMIMDPDDPLRYQFFGRVSLGADLGRDWYLRSSVALNLYNDWDTINRTSDSVLPRVRSEIRQYLQQGETGIDTLFLEKRGTLSGAWVYRGYGGILEEMFSGVGAEILYRPFPSRFAFGANLNYVWQRDYDKRFGHQPYSVLTGHASVYWASPFYNFDAALHAGRYLAGDLGATFELRRTFSNGWMVGGFFTLTDVPFDEFGEGSFDKGLFFRIPFNGLLPGNTRSAYQTVIRTIQRDGGARLEGVETLWWEGRSHRADALTETRQRMLPR